MSDENKRLNDCLEQILKEIEEKSPLLQRQREEYEEAMESVATLSQRLETAMKEEEVARARLFTVESEAQRLQRENKALRQGEFVCVFLISPPALFSAFVLFFQFE